MVIKKSFLFIWMGKKTEKRIKYALKRKSDKKRNHSSKNMEKRDKPKAAKHIVTTTSQVLYKSLNNC